jgi:hypothetical protein
MLHKFDIANNVSQFKQPTVLKYLIEGKGKCKCDTKNLPNIKPIITMHDTKQITVKTNKK